MAKPKPWKVTAKLKGGKTTVTICKNEARARAKASRMERQPGCTSAKAEPV